MIDDRLFYDPDNDPRNLAYVLAEESTDPGESDYVSENIYYCKMKQQTINDLNKLFTFTTTQPQLFETDDYLSFVQLRRDGLKPLDYIHRARTYI